MDTRWKQMMDRIAKETPHQKLTKLARALSDGTDENRTEAFKALLHTAHNLVDRYNVDFDRAVHLIRPILAKLKMEEYHNINEGIKFISFPNAGIIVIAIAEFNGRLIPTTALTPDMHTKKGGTITIKEAMSKITFKGKGSRLLKKQMKQLLEETDV